MIPGLGRPLEDIPVFLPGKSHGQRSLADYSPLGLIEWDRTEHAHILLPGASQSTHAKESTYQCR